jgi:hypothetical protein
MDPPGSLLMSANIIYNQVTTTQRDFGEQIGASYSLLLELSFQLKIEHGRMRLILEIGKQSAFERRQTS